MMLRISIGWPQSFVAMLATTKTTFVAEIIADGPISHPTILYRYNDEASDTELGMRFLEITQLLNPYFTPIYSLLTENSQLDD